MGVLEGYIISFLLGMATMALFYFSTRLYGPGSKPSSNEQGTTNERQEHGEPEQARVENITSSLMRSMLQERVMNQSRITAWLVSIVLLYFLANVLYELDLTLWAPAVLIMFIVLIWADYWRLLKKMVSDEYGRTEHEARAMIAFILRHSDDYKGGKGRKIRLTPEEIASYTLELETQVGLRGTKS